MKFGTDINVPLRMNCNHFGGQIFHLSCILIYDQIPAKQMIFPAASLVLIS